MTTKSIERYIAHRLYHDAPQLSIEQIKIITRYDEWLDTQTETCEYCDTPVNSPNFAYHFCTGRKASKHDTESTS